MLNKTPFFIHELKLKSFFKTNAKPTITGSAARGLPVSFRRPFALPFKAYAREFFFAG
ncbi:Hypothetical protein Minf_1042 [Methylacidiphilum infernorum V4]|uniref:Uncharacterized protein n=1 Tax=Methylacidiphilum infernorum (isolate V4) TaxID=481448 RepID=B3DUU4_METI4|nr:Hypothetical protein Minf_1042 [Methylacidiphilum infernorum V4]